MPKYTKKNRIQRNKIGRSEISDDCTSTDDGVSSCSNISELASVCDEEETTNTCLIVTTENFDEKLGKLTEQLRTKDCKTRENVLEKLQTLLRQTFSPDCDAAAVEPLLNCLRRGDEIEGKLGASVGSLLTVQLGEVDHEYFKQFYDVLLPFARDESKPPSQRAKYIEALGLICFLSCGEISTTIELMNQWESMFSRCYLTNDGNSPVIENELYEVYTAALSSWTLLLTTLSDNQTHHFIRIYAPEKIPALIESHNAELRNQAGETIAILYEIAREIHSVFAEPPESLLLLLESKSKESRKSKSKREKRLQHATFREIYNSFEDGTTPNFTVKFAGETLEINSWTTRFYYSIFSNLLGSGVTTHLKENSFLRSIFELEEVEIVPEKVERHQANRMAFKLRTEQLKKSRVNKYLRYEIDDF